MLFFNEGILERMVKLKNDVKQVLAGGTLISDGVTLQTILKRRVRLVLLFIPFKLKLVNLFTCMGCESALFVSRVLRSHIARLQTKKLHCQDTNLKVSANEG